MLTMPRLNRIWSRTFIVLYILATLGLRMAYESALGQYFWVSFLTGFLGLLLLWALIKSGFLNPEWFGFEKTA